MPELQITLFSGINDIKKFTSARLSLDNILNNIATEKKLHINPIDDNSYSPQAMVSIKNIQEKTGQTITPLVLLEFYPPFGKTKALQLNLTRLKAYIDRQLKDTKSPEEENDPNQRKYFRNVWTIKQHAIQVTIDLLLTLDMFTIKQIHVSYFKPTDNDLASTLTISEETLKSSAERILVPTEPTGSSSRRSSTSPSSDSIFN